MKKTLLLWLFGLLLTTQVFAQNRSLSGTVKDATTGEALIGVNVTGKGTTIGTVTDIDGKYTLELPKEVSTLVFSYVGYTNVEKPILSLVVDASLSTDAKIVDEVVVTAVAIQREKRSTSFATTTVKSDDLNQTANTALTSLQGKAPGVRISQGNGQLGASSKVVLRG
ncbi:MAG TPA: carboxypeptidase-like regulatory domain-containing protein, partial [Chitinophagales bacterium]|nr:carboxypeptidase-like regulatory domain-containing protein [Chitinophagales bacterium]